MEKSFKNLNIKDFFSKFFKNSTWLFLTVLLIIFIFDALEIKKSVVLIYTSNQQPPVVVPEHGVKLDFEGYNKIIQKKERAKSFYPTTTPAVDPFSLGQ